MNGEFRLRVCYPKSGRLRLLSHLEVVHTIERTVRRAGLEYAITQGFSPHMKIAFGLALPVGTASEREYFDLWLTRYTRPDEALTALVGAAPPDLAPSEAAYVGEREPSLTGALNTAVYRVEVRGKGVTAPAMHEALMHVVSSGELSIERKGKTKVFDLARSLREEPRVDVVEGGAGITLAVRVGPDGSLRPESLLRAACERAGIEASSVRTTRLDTFVESDEGVRSRPM